jgi:hypothetical protein
MLTLIFHRPETNLGAIQLEGMQSQSLGGDKTVGAGRLAKQAFLEKVNDRLGPTGGVIAAGDSRNPHPGFLLGAGAQVVGRERIEAADREVEFLGGLGGAQRAADGNWP